MASPNRSPVTGGSRTASPTPSAASSLKPPSALAAAGSTLSKESLYAPLTTYISRATTANAADTSAQSAEASAPGNRPTSTGSSSKRSRRSKSPPPATSAYKAIPSNIRESSLIDHLTAISATYHCPTSASTLLNGIGAGLGKNNGGQGLGRRAYEDRIKQRSLVLLGGGLMTGVAGTAGVLHGAAGVAGDGGEGGEQQQPQFLSKSAVEVSRSKRRKRKRERGHRVRGSISNRERKRRLNALNGRRGDKVRVEGDGVSSKQKANGASSLPSSAKQQSGTSTTDALFALNDVWNDYIRKLLGLKRDSDDGAVNQLKVPAKGKNNILSPRTPAEISAVLSSAELIGAYVKIARCDSSRSYVGKEGIVVDTTLNTWRIAIPSAVLNTGKGEKKSKDENDTGAGKDGTSRPHAETAEDEAKVTPIWKERIVPKRRSELAFTIITENDGSDGDAGKRIWTILIQGESSH